MGPVQVLVVGLDQPSFSGEVAAELDALRDAGIVRLVDVLVVSRHDEETFDTVDAPDAAAHGELVAALLGPAGDEPDDDEPHDGAAVWSLGDAVPIGSTAVVALVEHVWAGPLRDAIRRAGGVTLDETWLAAEDTGRLEALMTARRR
jgi:hypothetical protein